MIDLYQPPKSNVEQEHKDKRKLILGLLIGVVFGLIIKWAADQLLGYTYYWYFTFIGVQLNDVQEFIGAYNSILLIIELIVLAMATAITGYVFARIVNRSTYFDMLIFILITTAVNAIIQYNFISYQYLLTLPFMFLGGYIWMRQFKLTRREKKLEE